MAPHSMYLRHLRPDSDGNNSQSLQKRHVRALVIATNLLLFNELVNEVWEESVKPITRLEAGRFSSDLLFELS